MKHNPLTLHKEHAASDCLLTRKLSGDTGVKDYLYTIQMVVTPLLLSPQSWL